MVETLNPIEANLNGDLIRLIKSTGGPCLMLKAKLNEKLEGKFFSDYQEKEVAQDPPDRRKRRNRKREYVSK